MISKALFRRLERLEADLMLANAPQFMEIRVIASATGEVIQRIMLPLGHELNYRARRTGPWQQADLPRRVTR